MSGVLPERWVVVESHRGRWVGTEYADPEEWELFGSVFGWRLTRWVRRQPPSVTACLSVRRSGERT